jgi:hypothetical protein
MNARIEYRTATLGQMRVETTLDDRTGRPGAELVVIGDERFETSNRFWTSLYARYGFAKSLFNYFSPDEVFSRVSQVRPRDRLRYCVEQDLTAGTRRLLAVSSPSRAVVRHDDLAGLFNQYGGERISYQDGVVESHHIPSRGASRFQIAGDAFSHRFVVRTPIDGYGTTNLFLALLREICSNGMVAMNRAFRSELAIGRGRDNVTFSLARALEGFNNEEGYSALRQRFTSAATSWASVSETLSLYNLLARLIGANQIGSDGASTPRGAVSTTQSILVSFHKLTGDVSRLYGMANLDALSAKRQRILPVDCKVYDLLNFATEVATHHVRGSAAARLHAWAGTLISSEFDLEGTADRFGDFRDFFTDERTRRALDEPTFKN